MRSPLKFACLCLCTFLITCASVSTPESIGSPSNPEQGPPGVPVETTVAAADAVPLTQLTFSQSYFPGTRDPNGQLMGGVECNYIVAHKGHLFATVSTWKQRGWNRGATIGPQVLIKRTHDGPWEVDHTFGPRYGRAEHLRSVTFTTDRDGNRLPQPVTLLLATTTNFEKQLGVWSRNDATSEWTLAPIGRTDTAWKTEIRTLIDHVDTVTGVHALFVPTNEGTIYRGVYDPDAPGQIAWDSAPELDHRQSMPKGQRMPAAAIANDTVYVSMEMNPNVARLGGVFRRIDGDQPRWEHVYEWDHAASSFEQQIGHKQDRQLRGLTALPSATGNTEILIGARPFTGEILQIDPSQNHTVTVAFDAQSYFNSAFASSRSRIFQLAPNSFTTVIHPDTQEKLYIAGLYLSHPEGFDTELGNSSWFLVRDSQGTYRHGRIWDANNPLPNVGVQGLRTARTVAMSPFREDEGRVFYFGGFDSGLGTSQQEFDYTAWIYRGELPNAPR